MLYGEKREQCSQISAREKWTMSTTKQANSMRTSSHPTAMRPGRLVVLVVTVVLTGLTMATYLLIRPYGDKSGGFGQAQALASPRWVLAHVCGMIAIGSFAALTVGLREVLGGRLTRLGARCGVLGTALVLPYYGAETFALHIIGARAVAGDEALLALVDPIRYQPVVVSLFAIGLLLLAVAGVLLGLAWMHSAQLRTSTPLQRWAAWPLGTLMMLLLPQFYLPATGRMLFGVLYALAAAVYAASLLRFAGTRE